MRNLEQIQETDANASAMTFGKWLLLAAVLGSVTVAVALIKGGRSEPARAPDPLAELLEKQKPASSASRPSELSQKEIAFPGLLSDEASPPTVFAAVRGKPASSGPITLPDPPPPQDRLSVAPLPAREVLEASAVVTKPRDTLTKAAAEAAEISTDPHGPMSESGHDGGFQLQVSSFRNQDEAHKFSEQLRARGHKAHVLEARVSGRGTWYRVRVGPFTSHQAAAQYRSNFETKEHVVPFIVPPATKK